MSKKTPKAILISLIRAIGEMTSGHPDGPIDPIYTRACREYDPDYKTDTPLTMEEWMELTRGEDMNFGSPFDRDIKDAVDPRVFLFVLRDRMVFSSGCTDQMIRVISIFVDPH